MKKYKQLFEGSGAAAQEFKSKKDSDAEVKGMEYRSKGEKDFRKSHKKTEKDHPVATSSQFKGGTKWAGPHTEPEEHGEQKPLPLKSFKDVVHGFGKSSYRSADSKVGDKAMPRIHEEAANHLTIREPRSARTAWHLNHIVKYGADAYHKVMNKDAHPSTSKIAKKKLKRWMEKNPNHPLHSQVKKAHDNLKESRDEMPFVSGSFQNMVDNAYKLSGGNRKKFQNLMMKHTGTTEKGLNALLKTNKAQLKAFKEDVDLTESAAKVVIDKLAHAVLGGTFKGKEMDQASDILDKLEENKPLSSTEKVLFAALMKKLNQGK